MAVERTRQITLVCRTDRGEPNQAPYILDNLECYILGVKVEECVGARHYGVPSRSSRKAIFTFPFDLEEVGESEGLIWLRAIGAKEFLKTDSFFWTFPKEGEVLIGYRNVYPSDNSLPFGRLRLKVGETEKRLTV